MRCQNSRASLCITIFVCVLLLTFVEASCVQKRSSTIPPATHTPSTYTITPITRPSSTTEAIVRPRARPLFSDALFVVLSADQTQLLAAYEGNSHLHILYQFPFSTKAQVSFYPADFPVISKNGIWITVIEDEERFTRCIYRVPLIGSDEPRCVLNWPGIQVEASVSADGARVAFLATEDDCPEYREFGEDYACPKHIYVMDVNGDNIKRVTAHPADFCFLRWSPNDAQIAYREVCDPAADEPPKVYVITLEPFNTVKTVTQITASGVGTTWLPNGSWLQWNTYLANAGILGERRLSQLNTNGQIVEEVSLDYDGVWSPDASKLAWITREQVIAVWDMASNEVTTAQLVAVRHSLPMKWLDDGERLVFAGYSTDSVGQKVGERKWFVVNVNGTDLMEFDEP